MSAVKHSGQKLGQAHTDDFFLNGKASETMHATSAREETAKTSRGWRSVIVRSALLVTLATLLIKPIAIIKEMIVAARFGTTAELDAFVVALALLTLLSGIYIYTSQCVLVPLVTAHRMKRSHGDEALSSLLTLVLIGLAVSTGIYVLISQWGLSVLFPGFDSHRLQLASQLSMLMAPMLILWGVNGVLGAAINAHEGFFWVTLTQAILPISIVGWVVASPVAWGVQSLVWGHLAGSLITTGILIYLLRRSGLRWRLTYRQNTVELGRVLSLAAPLLIGFTLSSFLPFIDQIMASTLPTGSISALNYAYRLTGLLSQIFIASMPIAVLPYFSQRVIDEDIPGLKHSLRQSLGLSNFILLPLVAIGVVLAEPLVASLFQRGQFTAASTDIVVSAFIPLVMGAIPMAIGFIVGRIYNALGANHVLLSMAVLSLLMKVVLSWLFVRWWSLVGLAVATSLTYTIVYGVLVFDLRRRVGPLGLRSLFGSSGKTVLLAVVGALLAYSLAEQHLFLGQTGNVILSFSIGLACYALLSWLWGIQEAQLCWQAISTSLRRRTP